MNEAGQWLGAWLIVIVVAIMLVQSGWGKSLVYYGLWLALAFLLVTHATELTDILTKGGIIKNGNS